MKKYATKKDATLEHIAEQTSVRWTQFLTIPSIFIAQQFFIHLR